MRSILVTGCNRGLGLGLIKHLVTLDEPPANIFATCRDVTKATELRTLADKWKNIHVIEIDLTETKKYDQIVKEVTNKVGDAGLNVLFNNAGISSKFARLGLVKEDQLKECFFVNTIAPIMLTKALLPVLKQASLNYGNKTEMSVERAAVINMSSILGSIMQNDQGGFYPYRCSKSAINAATKSMSIDLKDDGILVTCLHPGWVRTDMGGPNAPMDINTSIKNILKTLKSLTSKHNGCFIQHNGEIIPW